MVDEPILYRIAKVELAHAAWDVIKKQYQGSSKVVSVRKQPLRQDFETLQMDDGKSIQDYCSRVVIIVTKFEGLVTS